MKKLILFIIIYSIAFSISAAYLYNFYVIKHPGEKLQYERIKKIFSIESPVFYDNEKSIIGVFFQEEHRKYVRFDELPKDFINALIAAEDRNFFTHRGFDPLGILRAAWLNIKKWKLSYGGSTITQQTAKNIFERRRRTFSAKFKELINALRLEAHYSKEQILEWYANQFFVSGNGRGIGIASEYFFNKLPKDLNLVESAFIAGCVKGPNRYNPFIQKTSGEEALARSEGKMRMDYVLRNMRKLGKIDQKQFEEGLRMQVPFNQGKISFPMITVMDYIRDRINSKEIQTAFKDYGIDNISTSGIKIYTTLNKKMQEDSLLALRKNLSALETKLTGYETESIQKRYQELDVPFEGDIEEGGFFFGKVIDIKRGRKEPAIKVELTNGTTGTIDKKGLKGIGKAFAQNRIGMWADVTAKETKLLLKAIKPGDQVFVRLRRYRPDKGEIFFDLDQFPEVNGGVIVTHKGQIKVMVGGFTNFFFNRAVDAKRQVGSVFKPIVFLAAMHLGWNNLDILLNGKNVFPFGNEIYLPKPDHKSPYNRVSMAWAVVKSENLAAVWLLYHLCDQLTLAQFRDLAGKVGLAQRASESNKGYIKRIRDETGVMVNNRVLKRMAFEEAKKDISVDLIFEGKVKEAEALEYLKYGEGFMEYMEKKKKEEEEREKEEGPLDEEDKEDLDLLLRNYLRLKEINVELKEAYWSLMQNLGDEHGLGLKGFYQKKEDGKEKILYSESPKDNDFIPLGPEDILWKMAEKGEEDLQKVLPLEEIWVDGMIPSRTIDAITSTMGRKIKELKKYGRHNLGLLKRNGDFRVIVALRYVVMLAKGLGIDSRLDPVLSFPLGANAISLLEAAKVYSAIASGKIYSLDGEKKRKNQTFIISKILSAEGDIIYAAKTKETPIIDRKSSYLVVDMLRNAVAYGTGRAARQKILLSSSDEKRATVLKNLAIKIPAYGKTGTSNDYRNSSFVGFIPGFDRKKQTLDLNESYVIAVYLGYDDNRSMRNKTLRIFGASGALPVWIEVANAIVSSSIYQKNLDLVDLAFQPRATLKTKTPSEALPVWVDGGSGIFRGLGSRKIDSDNVAMMHAFGKKKDDSFIPDRWFVPFTGDSIEPRH